MFVPRGKSVLSNQTLNSLFINDMHGRVKSLTSARV